VSKVLRSLLLWLQALDFNEVIVLLRLLEIAAKTLHWGLRFHLCQQSWRLSTLSISSTRLLDRPVLGVANARLFMLTRVG